MVDEGGGGGGGGGGSLRAAEEERKDRRVGVKGGVVESNNEGKWKHFIRIFNMAFNSL